MSATETEGGARESTDDLPTVAARPSLRMAAVARAGTDEDTRRPDTDPEISLRDASGAGASLATNGSNKVASAVDAMRADEIARARVFFYVLVAVTVLIWAVLPLIGGDPTAKWVFAGTLVMYIAALAWFVAVLDDPSKYTLRYMLVPGAAGVVASYAGVYLWGPFSPAPAMIVMALYFNSLIISFRYTLIIFILCAVLQALLAALVATGAIVDRGIIRAQDLDTATQIATQLLVQGALFATFLIARLSRRSTLRSVEHLETAVRELAHRDALLREAKQELARAAWVGGPGRFTEQIIGSFRLGVVIGRGAMGEIYEATHTSTGELAAVKLLHRNVLGDPAQVARFTREAQAAGAIDSPHVVRVLEVSEAVDALPYIAMERLHGKDLGRHLRKRRRFRLEEVLELVQHIAAGVDAAGDLGIVHRDLKPQNVFMAHTEGGGHVWKVLDFGVSKLADSDDALTRDNVIGTPNYMAPEQARGKKVDRRADVYALGAIAYRALTGHPPFSGKDVLETLHHVIHRMPKAPQLLVDMPADVELVLAIALTKRPRDRFARAEEFADALSAAARDDLAPELRGRAQALVERRPWRAA